MQVLVAVDLNDADADAFVAQAATWVAALGGVADLLFVDESADQHPYISEPALRASMSVHYDDWRRQMAKRIEALRDTLPQSARGRAELVRGRAAPVILERLEAGHDVVILGNRAASGLARLAHGVVAERVSRQATKPVVILPRAQ